MILKYALVMLIFFGAISIFVFGLHFSKYKKRNSGCCGGANCDRDPDDPHVQSCYQEKLSVVEKYKMP